MTWKTVDLKKRRITFPAPTTKSGKARTIVISERLAAYLDLMANDPTTGKPYGPDAFLFGEGGLPPADFKRAWQAAVLKAHGKIPGCAASNTLSPTSRAELQTIDLHFHDLRASRRHERAGP